MKKLGLLTATLLFACSGSKKDTTRPEEPMAANPSAYGSDSTASVDTTTTEHSGSQLPESDSAMERTQGDGTGSAGWAEVEGDEAAMAEAGAGGPSSGGVQPGSDSTAMTPTASAEANLVATKDGSMVGTVTFEQQGEMVNLTGTLSNLPPGPHSVSIHEGGNCTRKGTLIGKPFAPGAAPAGATGSAPSTTTPMRAGEVATVVADASGKATLQTTSSILGLEEGEANSIVRRAVVIYSEKADAKTKAMTPIACGVIEPTDDSSRSARAMPRR